MRVTDRSRYSGLLSRLQSGQARANQAVEQGSSGLRVSKASDDPKAFAAAQRMRANAGKYEAYADVGKEMQSYFQTAEASMTDATNTLDRAFSLAQQMGSGTWSDSQMAAAAEEISGLRESLLDTANTTYRGASVFGGTDDRQAAYDDNGQFQGAANTRPVRVAPGETVTTFSGLDVFGDGQSGAFAALETLETALRAGDQATVSSTIDSIDESRSNVIASRQEVGYRMDTISQAQNFLESVALADTDRASQLTDADLVDAVINVRSTTATLQAAVQAASRTELSLDALFKM